MTPKIETLELEQLRPDEQNPRGRGKKAKAALGESLKRFGAARSIVVDGDGVVRAGNGTLEAAKDAGISKVVVVEAGRDTLVAVKRPDLVGAEAVAYGLADNRTSELAEWNTAILAPLTDTLKASGVDIAPIGFDARSLDKVLGRAKPAKRNHDKALNVPEVPTTKPGDLWRLGNHRLACGDARDPRVIDALCGADTRPPLVVSDPPYCSGGFQEASRKVGSWGLIAGDNLSSKGWAALMTAVLTNARPRAAYLFTDWRMWSALFDVVEGSGLPVRAMLVWDKQTPALGSIWRTQHELCAFATRDGNVREKGRPTRGNVISCARTPNEDHYTQKPVELMRAILENDEASQRERCDVLDPFSGSGTTLLACEELGRRCFAVEIEPKFCDVIVRRWEEATGGKAERQRLEEPSAPSGAGG